MTEYKPQYEILDQEDFVPREQMQLPPECNLTQLDRAELANLRRKVGYKIAIADSSQNRNSIALKTAYFQMVAYKEGWVFDPQLYQVQFIHPEDPLLESAHGDTRVARFKEGAALEHIELSSGNNLGFRVTENKLMDGSKADGLVKRVLHLFR